MGEFDVANGGDGGDGDDGGNDAALGRRRFLCGAARGLAGAIAVGVLPPALAATPAVAVTLPTETVQDLIDAALTLEQAATTFYYNALTTRAVMRERRMAGRSANPNRVSPDGDRAHCAAFQAALDQEQKHARLLTGVGARSRYTHFYFPPAAFEGLGYTSTPGTFLWVLDHIETAAVGTYILASNRFAALGRFDLAAVALRILAVECEHRALYRVFACDDPANNVTLEVAQFARLQDAVTFFTPYLTGHGFPGGIGRRYRAPTAAQTARAIGHHTSM